MKKYLYLLIALFCSLTACTDSNEIDIVQQKDVTLNVNLAGVYEGWGINNYKNYLGNNKSRSIGIFNFIYNKEGGLIQKVVSSSKTIHTVSQNIGVIKAGTYNVVTFVTMINDADMESPVWEFTGEDDLNTLTVRFRKGFYQAYWSQAFGLANTEVKIGENTNVTIIPKPIGSVITIGYENLSQTNFNYFSFSSQNNAEGLRLAPNLSESDRYQVGEYDPSNEWGSLGYFYTGSSEALDNADEGSYYTFETGNRSYLFGGSKDMWVNDKTYFDATLKGSFNFEDGKMYVAFAYYVGYPDYFKTFVGLPNEFNTWYNKLDKTTNPIFANPCTTWGSSVSYVKSFMQGNELLQDIQAFDYGYYMVYEGKYLENYVEYDFVSATDGLESIFIPIFELDASAKEIEEQLIKYGYQFDGFIEGDGDDLSYDLFSNENTLVGVFKNLINNGGYAYTMMQFVSGVEDTRSTYKTGNIKNEKRLIPIPVRNKNIK